MKSISRVLSSGLPIAAAISTISSGAAFAQVVNFPIVGVASLTVTNGRYSINRGSVLTPLGTLVLTNYNVVSGNINVVNINSLSDISKNIPKDITVGTTFGVTGTTTGKVNFNNGAKASFVDAPSTIGVTVKSISSPTNPAINSLSLTAFPLARTDIGVSISGNIAIPTSSIVGSTIGISTNSIIAVPTTTFQTLKTASEPVTLDTAFSSNPNAVFVSSLSSRVSPYLNNN